MPSLLSFKVRLSAELRVEVCFLILSELLAQESPKSDGLSEKEHKVYL